MKGNRKHGQPSSYISYAQALKFRDAAVFSYCLGRPLNEWITIHLKAAVFEDVYQGRARFMKQLGDWLGRAAEFAACYIWVLENPSRTESGMLPGIHLHLCVHVPAHLRLRFRDRLGVWLVNAGGRIVQDVIKAKRIKHSEPGADPALYIRNGIYGLVRYQLKGIDPAFADRLAIRPFYQGVVLGKRLGYSEALGAQHRWHVQKFSKYPGVWVGGETVRRRHWVRAVCPDLLAGFQH